MASTLLPTSFKETYPLYSNRSDALSIEREYYSTNHQKALKYFINQESLSSIAMDILNPDTRVIFEEDIPDEVLYCILDFLDVPDLFYIRFVNHRWLSVHQTMLMHTTYQRAIASNPIANILVLGPVFSGRKTLCSALSGGKRSHNLPKDPIAASGGFIRSFSPNVEVFRSNVSTESTPKLSSVASGTFETRYTTCRTIDNNTFVANNDAHNHHHDHHHAQDDDGDGDNVVITTGEIHDVEVKNGNPLNKYNTQHVNHVSLTTHFQHEDGLCDIISRASSTDAVIIMFSVDSKVHNAQIIRDQLNAIAQNAIDVLSSSSSKTTKKGKMIHMPKLPPILILQNKIDSPFVTEEDANTHLMHIKDVLAGTIAQNAPVYSVSASRGIHLNFVAEWIAENVRPLRDRDLLSPLQMTITNASQIMPLNCISNQPNQSRLVVCGRVQRGILRIGQKVEIAPNQSFKLLKPFRGQIKAIESIDGYVCDRCSTQTKSSMIPPIESRAAWKLDQRLLGTGKPVEYAFAHSGIVVVEVVLDTLLSTENYVGSAQDIGNVLSAAGSLPPVWNTMDIKYSMLRRKGIPRHMLSFGNSGTGEPCSLLITVCGSTMNAEVVSLDTKNNIVRVKLPNFLCAEVGDAVCISKRCTDRWNVIARGILINSEEQETQVLNNKPFHRFRTS